MKMSSATVTYHELPPMSSWASEPTFPQTPGSGGDLPPSQGASPSFHHPLQPPPLQFTPDHSDQPWPSFPYDGSLHSPYADCGPSPHYPNPNGAFMSRSPFELSPGGKKRVGVGGMRTSLGTHSSAPEELCLVCGDKASGYHYNALTCEGCKGFFRRSITRKAVYYCKYGGNCDIDMYMRRKCQCCRLRKCMDIGMRPELVIPEDQCRIKREAKMKMRSLSNNPPSAPPPAPSTGPPVPPPSSPLHPLHPLEDRKASCSPQQVTSTETTVETGQSSGLTPEQRELLHRLLLYQQQYDMPSKEALAKLSTFSEGAKGGTLPFQHLAELTILTVQLIVEFTKHLPGFLTLTKDDQLTLLKACSTEVLMLHTARRYDASADRIVLGNRDTSWAYTREAYRTAGIGGATDAIFDFAKTMAKMKVDNAEYALLTAVAIFSDRAGLVEGKKVEDIQEVYTSTLQSYIDVHRPKNRSVFARLLMKLTDLRTLGSEQADMLFALKLHTQPPPDQSEGTTQSSKKGTDSLDSTTEEASKSTNSSQLQPRPGSQAGGQNIGLGRVPNVRIKVEPLGGQETGSGNHQLPSINKSFQHYTSHMDISSQDGDYRNHGMSTHRGSSQDILHQAVLTSFTEFNGANQNPSNGLSDPSPHCMKIEN